MVYIGSVSSFVKFGGETSKNVHDVWKVFFEMTFCVVACFIAFYVFVLDKIHVRGPKLVYKHVLVGNIWENISKDHLMVIEEGPFSMSQDCPRKPKLRRQSAPSRSVDSP